MAQPTQMIFLCVFPFCRKIPLFDKLHEVFFTVPKTKPCSRVLKFKVRNNAFSLSLKVSRSRTDLLPEDANPTLEMENKQIVSAAGAQDNLMMKPVDQRSRTRGRNDIMTRRIKNRERQRRYRARKRLESEIKKSSVIEVAPPPVQAEPESNGSHNNSMTRRIYCKRDWKKDARRAHALQIQQLTSNDAFQTPTGEPEAKCLACGIKDEPDRETQTSFSFGEVNIEPPRVVPSRRDWKAEARKKKS